MEVIVVLPTYNEARNLEPLAQALLGLGLDLGILVVDDGSPDGTGRIADALAQSDPRVQVLHRPGKQGLASAYVQGFGHALAQSRARLIAQMDSDFSHHPRYLPALVEIARQGAVALGSRYVPGGGARDWGLSRRLLSRWGNFYARRTLGLPPRDVTGGFRCWPRRVLAELDLGSVRSQGYAFMFEMIWRAHRAGHRLMETPIIFNDRQQGKSKMSLAIALEAARLPWRLRREAS